MPKDLSRLEKCLDLKFKNQDFLKLALVHRSYLNENPNFKLGHNERLEFLGDAVLELCITEALYGQYPNSAEGEMTNWRSALVNSNMLAVIAEEFKLADFIFLSRGEARDQNKKARQYILANAFEALIGAVYLDQGIRAVSKFIKKNILNRLPNIIEHKLYLDAKTRFQEAAQEYAGITPMYKVSRESGPDHAKLFLMGVYLGDDLVAQGSGYSKQEAQTEAAAQGLKAKGWE